MLALSAVVPGAIIGTGVNTVSAINDTLENFLNRNHLGWIWSAIHWLLVKFDYSTDITIRKVENNSSNNNVKKEIGNVDIHEANKENNKMLEDNRIVENKNKDNGNNLQNKTRNC